MVYNRSEIEELLNRYFEGETSLQEEQTLKEYFLNADNVPAKWNYAKAMFTGFSSNKEVTSHTVAVKKKGMPLKSWHTLFFAFEHCLEGFFYQFFRAHANAYADSNFTPIVAQAIKSSINCTWTDSRYGNAKRF